MDALLLLTRTFSTSFLFFLAVYLLASLVIFRGWRPQQRINASSSFMSLAHGTPAVIMALDALLATQTSFSFASPNTSLHSRVLEFSMGYFLMDLLHYLLFIPSDILFILHHLATLYVLVTCCFIVHHGASEILVILILAEVTSCVQNVWSLCRFRKDDAPLAARLHEFLSPPFFTFFSIVRGILAPFWAFRMLGFYLSGAAGGLIPGWAWISWMVVTGTGILLSICWVSNHWIIWIRNRSLKAQKKDR